MKETLKSFLLMVCFTYIQGCAQFRNDHVLKVSEETALLEVCVMFTEHLTTEGQISFTTHFTGTASLDDYLITNTTFSVPADQESDICTAIEIKQDDIVENDETFLLLLNTTTVIQCQSNSSLLVTITDSTALPIRFIESIHMSTDEQGVIEICFEAFLDNFTLQKDLQYTLSIVEGFGTASILADYVFFPTSGQLNSSTEILCHPVIIIADSLVEENEYFNITLSRSSFVYTGAPTTIIITDDDGATLSFVDSFEMIFEGNAGIVNVSVCVKLNSSLQLSRDVSLLLNTQAGTATLSDYNELTDEMLTIPLGSEQGYTVCTVVAVIGDLVEENNETFSIEVETLNSNDKISVLKLHVTILDDGDNVSDCGTLSDPMRGQVLMTGTLLGNTAFYTCDAGHQLVGGRIRVCAVNGWTSLPPVCQDVHGITLAVEIETETATEPGVVTACFSAEVTIPLVRDAVFLLYYQNYSTATIEQDFMPEFSFIAIPTNFSGFFKQCLNFTILDDVVVEENEIIVYDVLPLSEIDSVVFPGNSNSIIVFTIFDEDEISIVLEVGPVVTNTTEPGLLTVCFKTELSQPLNREAAFELALSNATTATIGPDFLPDFEANFLTITERFKGVYEACGDVKVLDDQEVEREELIVYDVTPLSELDTVYFIGGFDSVVFTVFDDDYTKIILRVDVLNPNVSEPGIVTVCLSTKVSQLLKRDSKFEFSLSNSTTATIGIDFIPGFDSNYILLIPEEFRGVYEVCVNITILDDDFMESETIVYNVIPLSELDRVVFFENQSSIVVNIFDIDVDCGNLNNPDNGGINITTISVGGIATYNCSEGHVLVGVDTRVCREDGIWSDEAPTCEMKLGLTFEKPSYQQFEDIGLNNLAIRVCFRTSNFQSATNALTLKTVSGTAQGNEDFIELTKSITLKLGIDRHCVAIAIIEDNIPESNETFELVTEELGISTQITLINDDVDCGSLRAPENGVIDVAGTCRGDVATYFCNRGYYAMGNLSRVCQKDGTWSDQEPVCTKEYEFEKSIYEVKEDIGLKQLAVRVCLKILNSQTQRTSILTLSTVSGTATDGEDFTVFKKSLTLPSTGIHRHCVVVTILEDYTPEDDEYFYLTVEETLITTTIKIVDDDDLSYNFVGKSPIVIGNTVIFNLTFGRAVRNAACELVSRGRTRARKRCISGITTFTLKRQLTTPYFPTLTIRGRDGTKISMQDRKRSFRLGVRGRCSVHLIDDGIVIKNSTSGNLVAVIKWGLSAPTDSVASEIAFTCCLDSGLMELCTSPYATTTVLDSGLHTLEVHPTRTGNCRRSVPRTFEFQVP